MDNGEGRDTRGGHVKPLTPEEQERLRAVLGNPVSWGEHYLRNRDGSERGYWPHQAEDLLAPEKNIIHLDGRGVGKTISLSTDALHFAFTTMGGQGLIAAPQQGHLDTVVEEIEFQLDANPLLMRSLAVTQHGKPFRFRISELRLRNEKVVAVYSAIRNRKSAVVFRESEVGERKVLTLVLRVHMEHVAYPLIAQTIALLERFFTPSGIGVDNGGNGLAVVQELLALDKYKPLQLEGRLHGYDFGGMTTLAVRDGREVKKRTKELMTSLINGALQRRQLVLPAEDAEIEDQFTTHTYTLQNGNVVYSKGNDHIVDAVRCAMLAHEQNRLDGAREETVSVMPVITEPVFI